MLGDDWLVRPPPSREELAAVLPEEEVAPMHQLLRDLHLRRETRSVALRPLAELTGLDDSSHLVEAVVESRGGTRLRFYSLLGLDDGLDLRRLHRLTVGCSRRGGELFLCIFSSENIV